jgi:AcrR family transcriptional regulator
MISKAKRPRQTTRVTQILKCARDVFCEKGYNNTLISEIAERAGMVEGGIYYYFPSKRDLIFKVMEQWISDLIIDYERKLEGIEGTYNQLRVFVWSNLKTVSDEPEMAKMYYQLSQISDVELRDARFLEIGERYGARLYKIIEDAMASGEFRDDIPFEVALSLVAGSIHVNALALLRGTTSLSPEQLASSVTKVFCQGLAVEPRSEKDPLYASIHKIENALTDLKTLAASRLKAAKISK